MNKYSKITTFTFVGFIAVFFLLLIVMPKSEFSEMENRNLAQMPKFTFERLFNGKFTAEFEEYVTDQFAFRDTWVGMKYFFEKALLKTENNGIYFGKDGYLMTKFVKPDDSRLNINYGAVEKLSASLDIPVRFSLIPMASYVHADKLPGNANPYNQQILLDRAAEMDEYFDISQALLAHKDEYIYYRTDHHWTSDGAYYAYEKICQEYGMTPADRVLRKEYPEFYGTLYSNAGARMVEPDTVTTFMVPELSVKDENGNDIPLYDESFAEKKDKYSVFFGGNPPLVVLDNTEIEEGEKLLLIKDSYSNSLAPYLTHNFDEIHVWDLRANKTSISEYVSANGITQVLVLYSTENFASDTNIMFMSK